MNKFSAIIKSSQAQIDNVLRLAETGQIRWEIMPTPRPSAMRAFVGHATGYLINVAQANIADPGFPQVIIYQGMICAPGCLFVNLPSEVVNALYHRAAASQN